MLTFSAVFFHDNAHIHNAKKLRIFEEFKRDIFDHPPYTVLR